MFACFWPHGLQHAFPVLHCLPEFDLTHVHWVSDAIQPSPPSLPALNLSQHQGISSESALCIGWPKYWNFSFIISPSSEYSGLISFTNDWFDLLAAQGTLKSLLQHTIQKHQFFGAQSSLWSNFNIGQYKVIHYKMIYVLFWPNLFFSRHHRHGQDCDRQSLWPLSSLLISHLSRQNVRRGIMYLL